MSKGRLEAFSDGVIAVIITILVLELHHPEELTLEALTPLLHGLLSYVLSFVYLGIYWNNHHHLLQAAAKVDGRVLWLNLYLLFWLSLIPLFTAWMADSEFATLPVALYGVDLLMAALAFYFLERALIAAEGGRSLVLKAVGAELKEWVSVAIYAAGILGALFWTPWAGIVLYALVAALWFVPDRRIERTLRRGAAGE